ncbi:MAG: TlpA family protein disulfide reductase [Chitinophagaceae bacterium]|nr:TlpA family protein disulfide reductase [Chitinophagaceae bacterium]
MKKYQPYIIPLLMALALAAWAGRSKLRNLFPPKMKFADTPLLITDSNRKLSINELKGNVLIVSCFQTWCVDCARETPVLNQLAAGINSPVFKIVYITDEESERINIFRSRFASGNIVFARSSTSMKDLGITVFPTTFLLDKNGKIITTKLEGYDWLQYQATIKKLIAE